NAPALKPLRLAGAGEVGVPIRRCCYLLERTGHVSVLYVARRRYRGLGQIELWVRVPYHHQPIGILVRKRAQHHCVYYAEDGGVGADPERQGKNGNGNKTRTLQHHSGSEFDVLQEGFHHSSWCGSKYCFLR